LRSPHVSAAAKIDCRCDGFAGTYAYGTGRPPLKLTVLLDGLFAVKLAGIRAAYRALIKRIKLASTVLNFTTFGPSVDAAIVVIASLSPKDAGPAAERLCRELDLPLRWA
jgi:hypothetical protein